MKKTKRHEIAEDPEDKGKIDKGTDPPKDKPPPEPSPPPPSTFVGGTPRRRNWFPQILERGKESEVEDD